MFLLAIPGIFLLFLAFLKLQLTSNNLSINIVNEWFQTRVLSMVSEKATYPIMFQLFIVVIITWCLLD